MKYKKIPLDSLLEPSDFSICYVDHFWYVTSDNCVLKSRYSLQCNKDIRIMNLRDMEDCTVKFFKVLYIPIEYSGFV